MTTKNFDGWHPLKKQIDNKPNLPTYAEREIWWAHIGVNIGHEQDGKSDACSRPVLIVRKFNAHLFWGVPLSTQPKSGRGYFTITFKERQQTALLSQLCRFDAKRLTKSMGKLNDEEFEQTVAALMRLMGESLR